MTIRLLAVVLAGFLSCPSFADSDVSVVQSTVIDADLILADNRRKERRDDRQGDRDDKQDCRQEEGRVGDDKRECKQEGRWEEDDDEKGTAA